MPAMVPASQRVCPDKQRNDVYVERPLQRVGLRVRYGAKLRLFL